MIKITFIYLQSHKFMHKVMTKHGVRCRGGVKGGRPPPPDFKGKFFNTIRPQVLAGLVDNFLILSIISQTLIIKVYKFLHNLLKFCQKLQKSQKFS